LIPRVRTFVVRAPSLAIHVHLVDPLSAITIIVSVGSLRGFVFYAGRGSRAAPPALAGNIRTNVGKNPE
jgi:hypothetical protein